VQVFVPVLGSTLFYKGDSMKKIIFYAAGICLLLAVSFSAAGAGDPVTREEMDALKKDMQEMKALVGDLKGIIQQQQGVITDLKEDVHQAEEVITDLTDQITRYAERNEARTPSDTSFEVSLASRRMLAAYQESTSALERWHPEAFVDPSQAEAEGDEAAEADAASAKQQAQAEEELNRRRRVANLSQKEESLTRASRGLAGAGGALLIAGGIAFGVTGGIGGAVLMCIGGFLLLIALFVVGARARRRTQLEEERARLKSTDGQ